ncbi:MAG: PAS domain S-box protein, partial [Chromatiales bacterium]|nr:PAS domain S-box protein [Chromatiales bacterium]
MLISIMSIAVIVIVVSTVWLLYEESFNQQSRQLVEIIKDRGNLIKVISHHYEHNEHAYEDEMDNSVLNQIFQTLIHFRGFGASGEFSLGRIKDGNVEFLLVQGQSNFEQPAPVPVNSSQAEPMQRALQGESGTLIGMDYRSTEVLAAYEPIENLGWGIVGKINMSEVRAPYIKAALISALIATLVIAVGSLLIIRVVVPLLKHVKDEHKYLRSLFKNSPIGLSLCRMDGSLVETNAAYNQIIGRTLEESRKLSYWDITPERYRDMEAEQLWHLENRGGYGPYEKEFIHKDGHLVPVRLKGKLITRGGEEFIWSSVEDISDRVLAEREQRQAATIFESTDEGIVITDENNCITMVNSSYCEITGYSEDEVLGCDPNILQSGRHEPLFYQRLWQQLEANGSWRGEMWNRRKDGSIFPVWQQISVIKDD